MATYTSPMPGHAPQATVSFAEPIIDLVHLSLQTMGDTALEVELLNLFDKQAETISERLATQGMIQSGRWRADLAHTLKGSARAIGASRVAKAAEAYETRLLSGAGESAVDLIAAIDEARGAIRKLLAA